MSSGPEFSLVEQPLIDQLIGLGWKFTTDNLDEPSATGRESFRDVLLTGELKAALCRINRNPAGNAWLDEGRLTQAVNALQRLGTAKLTEANQAATELLLMGHRGGWRGGERAALPHHPVPGGHLLRCGTGGHLLRPLLPLPRREGHQPQTEGRSGCSAGQTGGAAQRAGDASRQDGDADVANGDESAAPAPPPQELSNTCQPPEVRAHLIS